MIYRCNVPMLNESGVCGAPATHFDSRVLPRKHLYCEAHRASDDPPIGLLDTIRPDWRTAKDAGPDQPNKGDGK